MTQLPTWHGEPLPPTGALASAGAGREPARGSDSTSNGPASPREPGSTAPPVPGQRAAPGVVIGGRYALRTAIGHGGMGTVWRASDTLLRRDVAVKEVILPPGLAPSDRDSMYQRTLREARAAAALSHPAVVQVYDVVTEAGRPWIVMELLQARSLAEMIVEDGPLAARAVAKIGIALLGALEVAHAAGVLHRDVKPANVLICGDGRCVLTDFGVARMPTDSELTTPGMVLGSPHFISPERAIGAKFGPPSDLFSLGVTLYTAVEGRPPFDKRDPFETMRAVVEEPPAQSMRAGPLAGVLYGLLEKDPARRWNVETARAVLRDLLAGPLASNAPAHMTDPYAVVRPAHQPTMVHPQQPSGQIGGRAMMAPGETVSGALRRMSSGAPAQAGPHEVELERTGAETYNAYGPEYAQDDWAQGPTTSTPPGSGRTFGGGASGLTARVKAAPSWMKAGVAAAVVLVLFLGIGAAAGLFSGDGGDKGGAPSARGSSAPAGPSFEVEPFIHPGGITVSVPKGWTKKQQGTAAAPYFDITDPTDANRRIRVNIEKASASPQAFLESAEKRLQTTPSSCETPYSRVGLNAGKLDGQTSAVLEYTCGSGEHLRHALWDAVVVNGKAYHFFVTVPDARFAESKAIFEQMVASFKLTTATTGG
ncbi:serine/threonine-protein kinase [Dactylosporangium sp. McL0621]|uniref:serine/threonine-protein kinase n=1 Tax=Dactylosporangium sp. McL0621 TaxID=3415678 RepID=UPI003CEA4A0A